MPWAMSFPNAISAGTARTVLKLDEQNRLYRDFSPGVRVHPARSTNHSYLGVVHDFVSMRKTSGTPGRCCIGTSCGGRRTLVVDSSG